MNWPPPSSTLSPPRPDERRDADPDRALDPPGIESADDRRRRSAVPAATWIALLGSALVLVAAVAVVASNWDAIGAGVRVAGLAGVCVGLLVLSERAHRLVPTTAGIVAHVGTLLVGFVGIAALSLTGSTWPGCLVVGGSAIALATGIQAGRWRRDTMHIAQVGGIALAATGLAALTGTTAGLVAAVASVALLAGGGHRRSAGLALLAVFSPLLTALADAGIGTGTLTQAGLVGERLSWSGPVVGLLAATVLGAVALRGRNNPVMLLAALSPAFGAITGLAAVDGSAAAWYTVPALLVIAAELGWWLLPSEHLRDRIGSALTTMAVLLTLPAWFAPLLVRFELPGYGFDRAWAVPTAATALALVLSTMRWRAAGSPFADAGIAATMACVVAVVAALGAPLLLVAVVAVAATALAAYLSPRLGAAAVHPTALWALYSIAMAADGRTSVLAQLVVPLGLLAIVVVIVIATRARVAAGQMVVGCLEVSLMVLGATVGALAIVPGHGPVTGLTAVAVTAAMVALVERRFELWTMPVIAAGGFIALDAATSTGHLDHTYWLGWVAATTAFGTLWAVRRSPVIAHAAAAAAVIALAGSTAAVDASPEDVTVMAMLATVALTGLAVTVERRTPLDAAAVTVGGLLLVTASFDVDPAWWSGAWFVVGLQVAVYGATCRLRPLLLAGVAVTAGAALSWIWTTGFDHWFMRVIEPADIRAGDLWFAIVSTTALALGLLLRTTMRVNSWLAYAASIAIPGLWLTSVHVDRSAVWALPLILTIGIVAAGLGAWRRLAAPLVGGTALTIVGTFLAAGTELTDVPTWVWLATGGLSLLGVALLIERSGAVGSAGLRELVDRWD